MVGEYAGWSEKPVILLPWHSIIRCCFRCHHRLARAGEMSANCGLLVYLKPRVDCFVYDVPSW